jgi:acyl-CoA dehydrogenase
MRTSFRQKNFHPKGHGYGIAMLARKGFSEDYDLIHLWEAARLFKTAPTSNNMILNFVAEQNLGLPRSY